MVILFLARLVREEPLTASVDRHEDRMLRPIAGIAIETGMRLSEIATLKRITHAEVLTRPMAPTPV